MPTTTTGANSGGQAVGANGLAILRRPSLGRIGLAVIVALGAAALSLSLGVAAATRDVAPAIALKAWPWDARARISAGIVTSDNQAVATPAALERARQAVKRDASLPEAFAVFAIRKGASREEKLRQLAFSRQLSRRELGTTVLLMVDELQQGNLAAALADIDIALRTSDRADELFTPLLVKTTADPRMIDQLAKVLAKDPPWGPDFLTAAVQSSPAPKNIADLVQRLAAAGRPVPPSKVAILISRLIDAGDYAQAWTVYRGAYSKGAGSPIRNGGFEDADGVTPFDWIMENAVDRWAARSAGKGASARLEYGVSAGAGGVVARQVLVLAPGHYSLSVKAGELENTRAVQPMLTLACVNGQEIARLPVLTARSAAFAVLAGCAAQELSLVVQGDPSVGEATGWIDDVELSPIAR